MLLVDDPSIMGRDPTGHRLTVNTHHPAAAVLAAAPASNCRARRRRVVGAATR